MSFAAFQSRIFPRFTGDVEGDDGSAAKIREMHPFRAYKLLRSVSRFSLQGLLRGLEAIHETDLALKTSGHPEGLLLEQLLIKLCAGV
jgi:DNA polymerase III delta subunit